MNTELKSQLNKEYENRIKMRKRNYGYYMKGWGSVDLDQGYKGLNYTNDFKRFNILNFKSLNKNNATNKKTKFDIPLDLKEVRLWCKLLGFKKISNLKYIECVKLIISI